MPSSSSPDKQPGGSPPRAQLPPRTYQSSELQHAIDELRAPSPYPDDAQRSSDRTYASGAPYNVPSASSAFTYTSGPSPSVQLRSQPISVPGYLPASSGPQLRALPFQHQRSSTPRPYPHMGAGQQMGQSSSSAAQLMPHPSYTSHHRGHSVDGSGVPPYPPNPNAGAYGAHYPQGTIPTPSQVVSAGYRQPAGQSPPLMLPHNMASTSAAGSPPQSPGGPAPRYTCPRCPKTFSRSHDVQRHIDTVHSAASGATNPCPHCGKPFSRPDSLKRHVKNGCEDA
ncbi:hypothetical protein PUNSTDRAFT_131698 [Punctularia strigosozonata HHB-11173 SS5]|uniref:uncharacterized protein n=1 Tax=Punctularia strigosozonata (strain HHB-11173) TaxID=741275 RepID=UPI0004417EF7|nr:uncharacterized protein PUNSTDRAFT_131698 [Punctularia strigosozonata HHB-11173 SS5]EIN11535.1 hypothetical protein PUNSTDRAFT_131698 [Punctularia strigosozonata HHB-11173 SS5]